MFCYHYCKKLNNNFFNENISLNNLDFLIKELNLIKKDLIKEYWINNARIISKNNELSFNYINDISIHYKNNFLIQNYEKIECKSFNFYDIDISCEYLLYENNENNEKILLKKYKDYLTLEIHSNNENDKIFLYNNILNNIK